MKTDDGKLSKDEYQEEEKKNSSALVDHRQRQRVSCCGSIFAVFFSLSRLT
jgi:hypothetical protein